MTRNLARRIPVVYRNTPLMPMRWGRAMKYVKLEKARFRLERKLGIRYLELLTKPCDMRTQKVTLGFDPGSIYDGFSIVSSQCHHENFELIHNKTVKKRMDKRRMYRRLRRSRLRNRPCRFDCRTKSKMVPTIRSMYDYRVWLIDKLTKIYSISNLSIEIPKFNFYKTNFGGYATQVMQGIRLFTEYLQSKSMDITQYDGKNTKSRRVEIFGEDIKNYSKSDKLFNTHCLDSYCLASLVLDSIPILNKKTRFITKIWYNRRELYQWKALQSTKHKPNQSLYKIYEKFGVIKYLYQYYGKQSVCRVQKYQKSFKVFDYIKNKKDLKFHKFRKSYGGTVYSGICKYGRYKIDKTNDIVLAQSAWMCRYLSKNLSYLLNYQHQNIEVA